MASSDTASSAEGLVLTMLVVGYVLWFTLSRLRRARPALRIGQPLVVALALRVLAVVGINATSLAATVRGGDETTFLDLANVVAATPWGRGFLPHHSYQLQTELFAAQIKAFALSTTALRMTQIGISMLGIILIAVSVYDLAGARPARLTMWLCAVEPANLLFNSGLLKEPLMVFASGLVVFGATKIWRGLQLDGIVWSALGGLIAIYTRSYAGWFLVSAAVLVLLHSALRRLDRPGRATSVIFVVVAIAFVATPTLLTVTSSRSLQTLQQSQDANTGGAATATGQANSDNLALEQVDFSSRGAVLRNVWGRIPDLVFRPYPWQLQDSSQQIGAIGSLVALAGLVVLLYYGVRARRDVITYTAPLLYPFLFLLIAYSLSAGNAGTGFRYRSHLVLLGAGMLAILRERVLVTRAAHVESGGAAAAGPREMVAA
jgi:hypothetical protein